MSGAACTTTSGRDGVEEWRDYFQPAPRSEKTLFFLLSRRGEVGGGGGDRAHESHINRLPTETMMALYRCTMYIQYVQ